MTTWSHDKQLEMLQLIKLSYEMTSTCLKGEGGQGGYVPNYTDDFGFTGAHFKNLDAMEGHDGHFHYTTRPRKLSAFLKYPEGPDDGICDPAWDPYPANVGTKRAKKGESVPDPLEGELRDYEWVARFSDYGAVEGNVFRKNGIYYMVFDGSELRDWLSDWLKTDILGIGGKSTFWAQDAIEEAYRIYQKALKKIPGFDKAQERGHVRFLGHSLGGGLASVLSAGIALDAFEQKRDKNKKPIEDWMFYSKYCYKPNQADDPLQNHVPTLTFNAPQMGWLFDRVRFFPHPNMPDELDYEFFRDERLDRVDVMSIRTNRDMVSGLRLYDEDGKQVSNRYRIGGRLLTLGDTVGRLESYFEEESNRQSQLWHPRTEWEKPTPKWLQENQSGLFFWHGANTLELALMDRVEEEEEEPEEVDPPQVRKDPLILDLNRDGKVSTTSGKRYFDMDANGVAERVSWAASGDGFLVMDRDGDGKITSGRELFGDHTVMSDGRVAASGFQALADLDSNKDGKIDASDEAFGRLRVWSDKDGDGKFEDHELSTLEEMGIDSIDLRYSDHRTEDENGNQIVRTGRFTWKDGDRGKVSEFLLERDSIHTLTAEKFAEPDDVAALPDLPQRGFLYSLHQAMVRDGSGELKKLTEQFVKEPDPAVRK